MTKLYQTTKNTKVSSIGLIFIIDIVLTAISFITSYQICTWLWPALSDEKMLIQLPIVIAVASLVFLAIGSSKGLLKDQGVKEVYSIFNAICLANILTIVLIVVHGTIIVKSENEFLIPVSIIIVHSLLSFGALVASRYFYYKLHDSGMSIKARGANVFLAGSLKDAKLLIQAFEAINHEDKSVIGFLNLDSNCKDSYLSDIPVIETKEFNERVIQKHAVSELIITKSLNFDKDLSDFLMEIINLPLKIKTTEIIYGRGGDKDELRLGEMSSLKIEDLYVHEEIRSKSMQKSLTKYYRDKKVLILGAAGCVGSELTKKILKYRCKNVLALDKSDDSLFILEQELKNTKGHNVKTLMADILDRNRMGKVFEDFSPDIVINAAGYKIFDFTKSNLYEALKLNVLGNKLVSELAIKHGAEKYVNLTRSLPIKNCTYARATERIAEVYLNCLNSASHTEFINIRFGNVLESPSSVINVFKNQSEKGGPIKISHTDAYISFISVYELSQLVIEGVFVGKAGNILFVDKGDLIKEFDLAKQVIKLAELRYPTDIDIVVAENLEVNENLCELAFTEEKLLRTTENEKLNYIREEILDTKTVKSQIDELCITNMLFNEGIIELMDGILQNAKNVDGHENLDEEKGKVGARSKSRPLKIVG